ncbi:MAG: hypothetical protein PHS54_04145 [Clostridia bacterium]|nr:hypothetical protein [Clostridia bacterium]
MTILSIQTKGYANNDEFNLSDLNDVNDTNKGISKILKVGAYGVTHEYVDDESVTDPDSAYFWYCIILTKRLVEYIF